MADDVVFLDEQSANTVGNLRIVPSAPKGTLAWLVKNKAVKNAKQGEQLLLAIAIVAAVLAVAVYFFFGVAHPRHLYLRTAPGVGGRSMPISNP